MTAGTDAYAAAELFSSTFTLPTGHHSVKAKWTPTYSIDLVAKPGPSPQSAFAFSEVYVNAYVYDETNHSYIQYTHDTILPDGISSGSLVKTFHGVSLVSYVNGTFATGHSYSIVVYFEVYAEADVSAGSSAASALINAGTSGKLATLDSITAN
jgi:hypothetical protein